MRETWYVVHDWLISLWKFSLEYFLRYNASFPHLCNNIPRQHKLLYGDVIPVSVFEGPVPVQSSQSVPEGLRAMTRAGQTREFIANYTGAYTMVSRYTSSTGKRVFMFRSEEVSDLWVCQWLSGPGLRSWLATRTTGDRTTLSLEHFTLTKGQSPGSTRTIAV